MRWAARFEVYRGISMPHSLIATYNIYAVILSYTMYLHTPTTSPFATNKNINIKISPEHNLLLSHLL